MKAIQLYLSILLLFCWWQIDAQVAGVDQIHLLNNKKYTGTVIEQKPGEYIKLLLENGRDTFTFHMDEIDRIVKLMKVEENRVSKEVEESTVIKDTKISIDESYNKSFISTMLHYGQGGGDIASCMMGLSLFMKLNSKTKLGFSACYFGETGSLRNRPIQWQKIPICLEAMHEIHQYFNTRSALFTRLGVGYSFTLNGNYTDPEKFTPARQTNGLAFSPGLGYRFNVLKNTGIMVDVSYQLIVDKNVNEAKENLGNNKWDNVIVRASIFF